MRSPRTKEERRQHLFAFQGNGQLFEIRLGGVRLGLLRHPNRLMETFRSSNKGRRVT